MNKLDKIFSPKTAAMALLAFALLAQMPHAAAVFLRLSGVTHDNNTAVYVLSIIHASAYALGIEFATLFFVVHGWRKMAYVFAGLSVAVNLAYYEAWILDPWLIAQAVLVSIAIPVSIAAYSHFVADDAPITPAKPKAQPTPAEVQRRPAAQRKAPKATAPKAKPASPPNDAKVQALQMADDGMKPAEIARMINAKQSTVASWIRRSKQAQPAHANGTNGATPE